MNKKNSRIRIFKKETKFEPLPSRYPGQDETDIESYRMNTNLGNVMIINSDEILDISFYKEEPKGRVRCKMNENPDAIIISYKNGQERYFTRELVQDVIKAIEQLR